MSRRRNAVDPAGGGRRVPTVARADGETDSHPHIEPRRVRFDFDNVPVRWLPGDPVAAQIINTAHILLPPGERWFVRVFRETLDEISDPQLRAEVKAFIAQESIHGRSHAHFLDRLAADGVDAEPIVAAFERWLAGIERTVERVAGRRRMHQTRVATVAAIEQFTAVLGEWVLTVSELDGADPVMLDLLRWHGAEELEHKCVAYDVHNHVNDHSYPMRLIGLGIAVGGLSGWWVAVSGRLLANDVRNRRHGYALALRAARRNHLPSWRLATAVFAYLRPGFHPSQDANLDLARDYFARSPAVQSLS